VARTHIGYLGQGTRREPKSRWCLTAAPEEQLMLMLTRQALGRVGNSMMTHKMTRSWPGILWIISFLAARVRAWPVFGLSGSVQLDTTRQGVTFNKDLSDSLGVSYDVDVGTTSAAQRKRSSRSGSAYQVTDHVSVEAQKRDPAGGSARHGAAAAARAGDRVLFEIQDEFLTGDLHDNSTPAAAGRAHFQYGDLGMFTAMFLESSVIRYRRKLVVAGQGPSDCAVADRDLRLTGRRVRRHGGVCHRAFRGCLLF